MRQRRCPALRQAKECFSEGKILLSPRKLHPVFHLKGGICVQKKDAQFPRVST